METIYTPTFGGVLLGLHVSKEQHGLAQYRFPVVFVIRVGGQFHISAGKGEITADVAPAPT